MVDAAASKAAVREGVRVRIPPPAFGEGRVAKLRSVKTDANLLLLKTNMEAGHAGASGRFDQLKEDALAYAFALKVAGKL